jgi:hypothetical protein
MYEPNYGEPQRAAGRWPQREKVLTIMLLVATGFGFYVCYRRFSFLRR